GGPAACPRGQRAPARDARTAACVRSARFHRPQPAVPRDPLPRMPQSAARRADRRRVGPAGQHARLDLHVRARAGARVGSRARRAARPARTRRPHARDRTHHAPPPCRHAAGAAEPQPPRSAGRNARAVTSGGIRMSTDNPSAAARHVPEDLPDRIQHYIDGEHVDSLDGATFGVLEPVGNTTYLQCAAGSAADVDRAVQAARRAFDEGPWPRMLPRERARVLNRIADIVESRDKRLAELESFDSGLPITQALGQARRAAENFRFFADLVVAQADDAYKVPGRQVNYVNRKPVGVAGLITPWNTPFMLESWKLAPAIATGNTVVL